MTDNVVIALIAAIAPTLAAFVMLAKMKTQHESTITATSGIATAVNGRLDTALKEVAIQQDIIGQQREVIRHLEGILARAGISKPTT